MGIGCQPCRIMSSPLGGTQSLKGQVLRPGVWPSSRRSWYGPGVCPTKEQAVFGEGVEVGGNYLIVAVGADVILPQAVDDDKHHVGTL